MPFICTNGHDITANYAKNPLMKFCPICRALLSDLAPVEDQQITCLNGQAKDKEVSLRSLGPLDCILTGQVTQGGEWLTLSPASVTIPGGETKPITLKVNSRSLPEGLAEATVIFQWNLDNENARRSQTIRVRVARPQIELRRAGAPLTGENGAFLCPLLVGQTSGEIEAVNTGYGFVKVAIRPGLDGSRVQFNPGSFDLEEGQSRLLNFAARLDKFPEADSGGPAEVPAEVLFDYGDNPLRLRVLFTPGQSGGTRVGIDFGTTKSSIAYEHPDTGRIQYIEIDQELVIPSVVTFHDGTYDVGRTALAREHAGGADVVTVKSIKRKIGKPDPVMIAGQSKSPVDIAALIIRYLLKMAEEQIGEKIREAVITHPDGWDDQQVEATREAGLRAGLARVITFKEAMAAALDSAHSLRKVTEGVLCIFDFGGGTLDIALIRKNGLDYEEVDKGEGGDRELGGDRIDEAIMDWLFRQNNLPYEAAKLQQEPANSKLHKFYLEIKDIAEQAKIHLTTGPSAKVSISTSLPDSNALWELEATLELSQFAELIRPLLNDAREALRQTLINAALSPDEIKAVLLVGGSSSIPAVREMIEQMFDKERVKPHQNPELAIVRGAAKHAIVRPDEDPTQTTTPRQRLRYATGIRMDDSRLSVLLSKGTPYDAPPTTRTYQAPQDFDQDIFLQFYQYTADDCDPDREYVYVDGDDPKRWLRLKTKSIQIPPRKRGDVIIRLQARVDSNGRISIMAHWEEQTGAQKRGDEIEIKVLDFD